MNDKLSDGIQALAVHHLELVKRFAVECARHLEYVEFDRDALRAVDTASEFLDDNLNRNCLLQDVNKAPVGVFKLAAQVCYEDEESIVIKLADQVARDAQARVACAVFKDAFQQSLNERGAISYKEIEHALMCAKEIAKIAYEKRQDVEKEWQEAKLDEFLSMADRIDSYGVVS